MFKKVLCTVAALAMVAGVFAGCGNKADQAAVDALVDQIETVTANYGGVADVVAQFGSVQQQEELDNAKAKLDEIAAKAEGELTKDDVTSLTSELASLSTTITSIGEAAQGNAPAEGEDEVDADALTDKFEQTATLLSGVYENVSANGTLIQQQVIADAQEELSEMQAGLDAGTYTAGDVMDALEFIDGVAQSINDEVTPAEEAAPEDEAAPEARNVNDELEALATLVSGARENIDAGDDQIKKDYIAIIQDTVTQYATRAANGEITEAETADVLDVVDVLTELVNSLNE